MTSLQHRLLLLLNQGQQLSADLYALTDVTEAHIRRTLIGMTKRSWVSQGVPVKQDGGQGRPMNSYKITKAGEKVLSDYEQELEALR